MKTVYEGKPEGIEKYINKQLPPVVYIWRDLILYIGQLPTNEYHRIAVDTFSMNLEQPYSITTDEGQPWENIKNVLWLANCPHQSVFDDDVMVFCFMEPTLRICNLIKKKMQHDKREYLVKLENEKEAIDTFTYLYNQRPDANITWDILCSVFNPTHSSHTDYMNHSLDRRIHAVTTMIKQNPEHNYSIKYFADHVNLSTSRLEHLFKQQTNISIARYRMWIRIKQFAKLIGLKKTLTEAATETGFVDASHFNRTFKYIVGMIPSAFFLSPKGIEILVADDF